MNEEDYKKKKRQIYEEDNKKIKELEEKYKQDAGLLDGGIPKKERNKITEETLEKLDKLEKAYQNHN